MVRTRVHPSWLSPCVLVRAISWHVISECGRLCPVCMSVHRVWTCHGTEGGHSVPQPLGVRRGIERVTVAGAVGRAAGDCMGTPALGWRGGAALVWLQ